VGKDYTYVSGCGWLKDEGTYAVMANARYGGCNVDGVTDGCGCARASNDQMWFRDIYDHTQGGVDTDGKYGGMLLVNADKQLVYSRKVSLPCANTNLIFSAWFATASKGATSSVRFFVTDSNGNEIKEATFPIEDIDFKDGWIKGETSFYTGDETEFTVEIHNYREGNEQGNDFLVDDISFSVCSPEIGLYAESTSSQVEIDAANNRVQGPCDEPVDLRVKTSMADVIYDDPQYLWFIKDADDAAFRHLENNKNRTSLPTAITPYTQYYVVTAATPDDAQNYLEGKFTCTPIAVSNTITVLCTPNLEITLQSRKCNDIVLKGTAYDAPNDFYFWWEKSTDGKNWQKIPRATKTDTLQYALSEPLYFRINSGYTPSDPTEELKVKGLTLVANPEQGISGTDVELTATATNLNMEGALYQWYRYKDEVNPNTRDNWWLITGPTDATLEHSIDRPIDRIKVTADGCEDEVEIKEITFDIEPIDVKCNDIYLQPVANLGGEPITFKWQRSADGSTWSDVKSSDLRVEYDESLKDYVTIITIAEKSVFRLAEIDAAGNETGLYSLVHPFPDEDAEGNLQYTYYTVKTLALTASPTVIKPGDEVTLTLTAQGFEATTAAQWYKDGEKIDPIVAPITLDQSATFEVKWEECSATADVTVITPPTVALSERMCNQVAFKATLTPGYGNYWWETATTANGPWTKLTNFDNKEAILISITENTFVRVNNSYNIPSNAVQSGDLWYINLTANKSTVNRGETVLLSYTTNMLTNSDTYWYQNGMLMANTAKTYNPLLFYDASFYVDLGGCISNTVNVTVIQPASVAFVSRNCNDITLQATVAEGVAFTWQQQVEGGKWENMTETGSTITVTITEPTQFRVVTAQVESEPTELIPIYSIALSMDKQSVIMGEEVTITATSSNIESSYPIAWYKDEQPVDNEGDTYTDKPYVPAKYTAVQAGCPSQAVTLVEVLWPTVFTPMLADGFNDDFVVGMEPKVALKIYDRYGNLVIETTDGWDGKDAKGNYAMPGVYYYVATLSNGDVQKGNVELLNEKK
jgi:gliding motility-associated-like protein